MIWKGAQKGQAQEIEEPRRKGSENRREKGNTLRAKREGEAKVGTYLTMGLSLITGRANRLGTMMAMYAGLTMARAEKMNQGTGSRENTDHTESREEADRRMSQEQARVEAEVDARTRREQAMREVEGISERILHTNMTEALMGRNVTNSIPEEVLQNAKKVLKEATETGRLHIVYHMGSLRREGYAIMMESHTGKKENCRTCSNRKHMMEESAIKIHEEANRCIKGHGGERKKQLFDSQIAWWGEREQEAREVLEKGTEMGEMHKVQRREAKAARTEYHRGQEQDCDRCAEKRKQQIEENDELVREEEQQHGRKAQKQRAETDTKGKGKQRKRLKEDKENGGEGEEWEGERHWVRNPHGEEQGQIDFARASTSGSAENKTEAKSKEESEGEGSSESEEDGECLGCGGHQRANTQCLYCGAPVEPRDGSGHYMYGWHEGSRQNCEDPRCREWVEREEEDKKRRKKRSNDQV